MDLATDGDESFSAFHAHVLSVPLFFQAVLRGQTNLHSNLDCLSLFSQSFCPNSSVGRTRTSETCPQHDIHEMAARPTPSGSSTLAFSPLPLRNPRRRVAKYRRRRNGARHDDTTSPVPTGPARLSNCPSHPTRNIYGKMEEGGNDDPELSLPVLSYPPNDVSRDRLSVWSGKDKPPQAFHCDALLGFRSRLSDLSSYLYYFRIRVTTSHTDKNRLVLGASSAPPARRCST